HQKLFAYIRRQVVSEEISWHLTPNFCTLHFGDMTFFLKFHPVSFVKLWSDQEVQIRNLVVFSHQCCCQSKFAMRFHNLKDSSEHLGWNGVYFIEKQQSPFVTSNVVHCFFCYMGSFS